jgi:hypothetical protein
MEWSTEWVLSKPLITEEIWPGQGLNPGLPNDTPALYQLLHELMLNSFFKEVNFFRFMIHYMKNYEDEKEEPVQGSILQNLSEKFWEKFSSSNCRQISNPNQHL